MVHEAAAEKARSRADRESVASYHQAALTKLLEHVRTGFARYDEGQIDAFELDELIHRYKRATTELWKFCGATGSQVAAAARAIDWRTREGQAIDWWEEGGLRRPRT
ncbi:MAG TPA: hypothetical protein VGR77_04665 [Candidatus Dormibacteraeota bacterium]|nr:hypothetical protein [Candidatus Dormibacteraeota bacterium]